MSPASASSAIAPIKEIVAELRNGRMVILVDEEDRENEGDLLIAAEHITPDAINFMVTHARGLVCLTLTAARARQLGLTPMARDNRSPFHTAFTVSIEAAKGVTTGISAHDRARTVQAAVARHARPEDVVQPGHVFPIIAREGGVLVRAGHTEAGCDLAQMAGLEPASVICEVLREDGTMARLPDLLEFAARHGLKVGTIADLIEFRSRHETLVERCFSKPVRTVYGEFILHAYADRAANDVHLALTRGEIAPDRETLVRVHEPLSVLDFLDLDNSRHTFSLNDALHLLARSESASHHAPTKAARRWRSPSLAVAQAGQASIVRQLAPVPASRRAAARRWRRRPAMLANREGWMASSAGSASVSVMAVAGDQKVSGNNGQSLASRGKFRRGRRHFCSFSHSTFSRLH